jgi:hypothetical protein
MTSSNLISHSCLHDQKRSHWKLGLQNVISEDQNPYTHNTELWCTHGSCTAVMGIDHWAWECFLEMRYHVWRKTWQHARWGEQWIVLYQVSWEWKVGCVPWLIVSNYSPVLRYLLEDSHHVAGGGPMKRLQVVGILKQFWLDDIWGDEKKVSEGPTPDDGGRGGIAQLGLVGLCTNMLSRGISTTVSLLEILLCRRLLHLPWLLGMNLLPRRMTHT